LLVFRIIATIEIKYEDIFVKIDKNCDEVDLLIN